MATKSRKWIFDVGPPQYYADGPSRFALFTICTAVNYEINDYETCMAGF